MMDDDIWPECSNSACDNEVNPKRIALGYSTCLECGTPRVEFLIVPVPKSNYVVGPASDLIGCYGKKDV